MPLQHRLFVPLLLLASPLAWAQASIVPADPVQFERVSLRQTVDDCAFDPERVRVSMHDHVIRVEEIQGNKVTIDGNHQLAGMTLHFDVAVREVRDATREEKAHGHVHGPGGHHH